MRGGKDNAADTAERRNYDKLCYTPDSRDTQLVYPMTPAWHSFIHFGLYAGRLPSHEWVKTNEKISVRSIMIFTSNTSIPIFYDPKEWAKQAKAAGMKYVVMTTKHHEGFCLFDSKYTDYKSTNPPCGKDPIKEYVEAFPLEGLRVGFYYSLIDWHHPDFPNRHAFIPAGTMRMPCSRTRTRHAINMPST